MRNERSRLPQDYIYERLTAEDLANLRAYMVEAADAEGLSQANCDLADAGQCFPCKPPFTEGDVRTMLVVLAAARINPLTWKSDWQCMLKAAFGGRRETIRVLYEAATGVTDSVAFAPTDLRKP